MKKTGILGLSSLIPLPSSLPHKLPSPLGEITNRMRKRNEDRVWRRTTVIAVQRDGKTAVGADGQVTLGATVMKHDAVKVRKLFDGKVLVGFAGSTADAFALLERFETKLRDFQGNVPRAAIELGKDWRTERSLRQLEAMMIACDRTNLLLLSGSGDVIAPSDGVLAVGSGGPYALAAARALMKHTPMSASEIVKESLAVAGDICIYSNQNVVVEEAP
jgi:ATP-dependent HslUV protease subunit HslV